jgi:hypothetical protein
MPIARALNQAQFAERKRLVFSLAQEAIERRSLPNGVRLCFAPNFAIDISVNYDISILCLSLLLSLEPSPTRPVFAL